MKQESLIWPCMEESASQVMAGCGNVVSSCWNVRTAGGAGAFHSSPISLLTFSHFLSHGILVTFIYSWGPHLWPQVYKKLESPHYLYSPCEKLHNYALFWEWRISSFGMALILCYGFGNRKTEVDCQLMSSWSCSTASKCKTLLGVYCCRRIFWV
jgi:hypothetical protein